MRYILIICALLLCACAGSEPQGNNSAAESGMDVSDIRIASVPNSIIGKMEARGEQENARPELIVESPKDGETINSSSVRVKVKIAGDLKGYEMGKSADGTGNHVHVILDNQPYAAHYMWDEGFELRNVTDGDHTLRMFPSRPWHQSYKNEEAFKILRFTVAGGKADESKPTTDDKGKTLADAKKPEGAEMLESTAGAVDFSKPLLTYSRPKGTYKGDDAKYIMVDFWLSNAKLIGDGGEYVVFVSVNDSAAMKIEKWEPLWLEGWKEGKNKVKLRLADSTGQTVKNGGYNETEREIVLE